MKSERIGFLLLSLVAVLVISSAALSAPTANAADLQTTAEATVEGTPEVFFNDMRVNNRIILGEFGIFCEDAQGLAATSYTGGRISVYGSNDQQYLSVEEEALRQLSMDEMSTAEPEATMSAEMTAEPQTPILLAQAYAMSGVVQLFLTGDNQFQLNGFLEDGKAFVYNWTGCIGNIGIRTAEATQRFLTTTPVATLMPRTAVPTTMATMQATMAASATP